MRIAVADDEPDMREYFERILPALGHEVVVVAATGAELVERCRDCRPELVITDIKMPDLDGLEAAAQIQRELGIPIIVVSGYQDEAHLERAAEMGVAGYLLKPIKRADLEACLARLS